MVAVALSVALVIGLQGPVGAQPAGQPLKIVALGDSLMAGYGLGESAAFPAQLERALKAKGRAVEIANAGVSGDTSSGGLERLDWSVPDGTHGVILGLGANDMLRGIDPRVTRQALETIVQRLKERGIAVMIAGMRAPPNLGANYIRTFDAIYPDLAKQHDLALYPFFLDGIAVDAKFNQKDGIHPTEQGIAEVVKRMVPAVEAWLDRIGGGKPG
jgi:acyl-CoA thioesterase I